MPAALSSPYLIIPADVPLPCSASSLFGRAGPLTIEIGFGNGSFINQLAAGKPEWNLIGAEQSPSSFVRAFKRVARSRTDNVRLYLGEGAFLLRHIVEPSSTERIFVNFPDPWPRRRHQDRRLLDADFLELAATRLRPGGRILLTTDHGAYFDFARQEAKCTSLLVERVGEVPAEALETRYARKWREQSRPIFHVGFERTDAPHGADHACTTGHYKEKDMQHALLSGDLASVGTFEKEAHTFPQGRIVLLDMLRALDGASLVFLVLVEEECLKQELLVEARPGNGGVFVGLRRFGSPLVTRAVGESVRVVVAFLERHGFRLLKSWF